MISPESQPGSNDAIVQEVYDIARAAHAASEIIHNLHMPHRNPDKQRRQAAAEEFSNVLDGYVLRNVNNEPALTRRKLPKEVRRSAAHFLDTFIDDKLAESVRLQRARLAEAKITLLLSGKVIEAVDTNGDGFETIAMPFPSETDNAPAEVTAPFFRYEAAGDVLWLGYPEEDMFGVNLWRRDPGDPTQTVRGARLTIVGAEEPSEPVELGEGVEDVLYETAQDPESRMGGTLRGLILARHHNQASS